MAPPVSGRVLLIFLMEMSKFPALQETGFCMPGPLALFSPSVRGGLEPRKALQSELEGTADIESGGDSPEDTSPSAGLSFTAVPWASIHSLSTCHPMRHLLKHQPQFLLGQFPCWAIKEPGRIQDSQPHTLGTLRVCHPSVSRGDNVVFDCQGAMLHSMKQQEEAFPGTDLLPSQLHVVQRSFNA